MKAGRGGLRHDKTFSRGEKAALSAGEERRGDWTLEGASKMFTNPQRVVTEEAKELRKAAGAFLRGVRERQGLTQHDVGTFAGYRYYTQYSALEQGTGRVPPERYASIAAALGLEPRYFARKMMRYYDPLTFAAVLDEADIDHKVMVLGEPLQEPAVVPDISAEDAKSLRREAGTLVKTLREAANLTQADLAEAMDYKFYTRVSQIERGAGRVPPEEFVAFAEALGVEPKSFVQELLRCYDPVIHYFAFERSVEAVQGTG
ncbi:MAG: helix-turn-helix transcriptional regulator [Pseudomonadota bacterium]|nr:helix-turn-helix transcriptional regulator [Pseudomonadota bacterium]